MRALTDLKWLLTAGKPSPALKAGTLLYLHGVRVSVSIRMEVRDVNLETSPAEIMIDGSRIVYITDELSDALKNLTRGKNKDDPILHYRSIPEFHNDFRRAVRTSKLRFDLTDIKEMFRASAGIDYPLLKQYESAQPFTPDDVKRAWLKVLPRLVVGV